MPDIDVFVAQALPAISAAVSAYGVGVLTRAEGQAMDATVQWGRQLLTRLFNRSGDRQARVEAAVADLAETGGDPDSLAALRLQLRQVLAQDPQLMAELVQMMPPPTSHTRSVDVGGNYGIVSTGDGATNIQHR
ncbi:hypothetical protein OG241_06420 [Streptomyces sp. NBC_01390]|uniref:hypothetical protein n=1 Tax=Streptomyces sp. NBC_01390 TaxID=2903850 RepID=UPI00324D3425